MVITCFDDISYILDIFFRGNVPLCLPVKYQFYILAQGYSAQQSLNLKLVVDARFKAYMNAPISLFNRHVCSHPYAGLYI
jgi:hypothetical protein